MFFLYNLTLCLLAPWMIIFFLKKKQAYENITALSWRLALYPLDFPPADRDLRIWIHGASVGEIKAIVPFVKALRESYPLFYSQKSDAPDPAFPLHYRGDGDLAQSAEIRQTLSGQGHYGQWPGFAPQLQLLS
jgi:hypothetical protein